MSTRAEGTEPAPGGRTQEPVGSEDRRYYYYLDRIANTPPYSVFARDHAYDCESLARKATESEVLALIGREALRAAKEECAWYGLGSKRLLVYVTTERERRGRPHRARGERAVGASWRTRVIPVSGPWLGTRQW